MPAATDVHGPAGLRRGAHYFPELEALRGVAIVLVYAFHVEGMLWIFAPDPTPTFVTAYLYGGNSGVGLFFVLSAFLLSMPFLVEAAGGPRANRRRYFERRALRILPLYYVVVLLAAAFTSAHLRDMTRALPYLVFANSFGLAARMEPWSNVMWSLGTEAQFYVVLPLLPLVLRSPRGRRIGLVLFALYVAWYAWFLVGPQILPWLATVRLGNTVLARAWLFLGGIAAAWVHLHHGPQLRAALAARPLVRNGGADVALLVLLALFGFVLRWMFGHPGMRAEYPPVHVWHVAEAITWSLVVLAFLVAPLRLKPLVCNPVFARLGLWSYSIYLLHVPILRAAIDAFRQPMEQSGLHALAGLVLLTVLVVGVSALSYRFIEQPFLVRKARLDA